MTTEIKTGYAPVNGLKMYYEIHGRGGDPLLLLHGGVGGIEMFGPNLAALSATRRIIAVNLQAHGHTADIDRPLRFELMADDIAALLKYLGIGKANLMGYSLGGGVALQTAIRHPQVAKKLVIISAPIKRAGWHPDVLANFDRMGPEAAVNMKYSPLSQLYPEADWPGLFAKIGDLQRQDYDWTREVAAIRSPIMIVVADADAVRLTHAVEFYTLLGGNLRDAGMDGSGRPSARLAILPGTTHYDILAAPTMAELAMPFLDAPLPKDG